MVLKDTINNIQKNPRLLFKIDAIGAFLSAFLLGVVLVEFQPIFGIPVLTLYFLAVLPCLFSIYDIFCLLKIKNNLAPYLKAIAIINLLYCCLSIGFAFYHFEVITIFGWLYILIEILIVFVLSIYELRVAKSLMKEVTTTQFNRP